MRRGWVLKMSPSAKYWWRFLVGQWLVFCWFWDQQTSDSRLARQKLGEKTHPDHGGCRRPTAAMVHPPQRRDIPQVAHTLRNKSMSLKLDNIYFITSYLLFKGTAHCRCAVPVLLVVSAAGGGFQPGKNIGNPSLYLCCVDSAWRNRGT